MNEKKQTTHGGEGGQHYKNNDVTETIELMENVAENVVAAGGTIKQAVNASYAMKHLNRLGTKEGNSLHGEILKAENYLHRARTGEWISK